MSTVVEEYPDTENSLRQRGYISASQLKTYAICPKKWLFSRIYPPEFESSGLVFGAAFHAGLNYCHKAIFDKEDFNTKGMLKAFINEFELKEEKIRYSKKESKDILIKKAAEMYAVYLEKSRPESVIASEEKFRVKLSRDMPDLLGFIDLLEIRKDEHGREYLSIVDFKTSARKPSLSSIIPDQLLLYYHAVEELGIAKELGLPVKLRYDYITKTKKPELISIPVEYSSEDITKMIVNARMVWKAMKQRICYPCPGWQCDSCGYISA